MATAITDEWTEEKCLQLIQEYRSRPVLWDPKNPFFFKKALKSNGWHEIGDVIGISPDRCKQKMIILMSSFRREKAKIMHSIKDAKSNDDIYKSTWFAFKELAFLMDKETERKRQSSSVDNDDDFRDTMPVKRTLLKHYIDPPIHPLKRARPIILMKERKTALRQTIQDEEVSTHSVSVAGPSRTTDADLEQEITSFTSFIGNKMKKYSETTKNAVQQAICEVIFKADQNHYESPCFENFTIIDDESEDPLDKELYDAQNGTTIKLSYSDNSD